jgi:hypothetical protein
LLLQPFHFFLALFEGLHISFRVHQRLPVDQKLSEGPQRAFSYGSKSDLKDDSVAEKLTFRKAFSVYHRSALLQSQAFGRNAPQGPQREAFPSDCGFDSERPMRAPARVAIGGPGGSIAKQKVL